MNPLDFENNIGLTRPKFGGAALFFILVFSFPVFAPAQDKPPAAGETPDLKMSPEEEIQVLDAIDSHSNTPEAVSTPPDSATPAATPAPSGPPPVPSGLKNMMSKEGVFLSWEPAPTSSNVSGYNVYRSTTPGLGYKLVNAKPLASPHFLDGPKDSLDPPENGEDYFYVVASINPQGDVSPYSDEMAVTPSGLEAPPAAEGKAPVKPKAVPTAIEEERAINVPQEKIVNLQLPADTQLSIQGYKKIGVQLNFQTYKNPAPGTPASPPSAPVVNQELVVNLLGKVGKNVDVNVDYSDVNRGGPGGVDQTKQNISIVYHGNEDSPIQEVAFGDLQLYLPNTEFAGFSKQLFGLQAKMKFDNFRFTSFFAQTKGIAETKVFTGNTVQVDKTILDTNYIPWKYFLITRDSNMVTIGAVPTNIKLPYPNSEQIWIDSGNGQTNPIGVSIFSGPSSNPTAFEHWLPGRDYTIDYSTGIITFLRGLNSAARIVVAYYEQSQSGGKGNPVGFKPGTDNVDFDNGLQVPDDGKINNNAHMIKDNNNYTATHFSSAILSPLYLVNTYDLGRDKIIPPQQDPDFQIQILSQGSGNIVQTSPGPQPGERNNGVTWNYNINLDLNTLSFINTTFDPTSPNANPGAAATLYFPERPFANLDGSVSGSGASAVLTPGGMGVTDVYSQTTPPTSLYSIHLHYKTKLDFYNLDRINIIRGSEAVYLDGRRLRRDQDYTFDYTSGFLDFQDKSILTPKSQVVVTYEYAPFGSFGQSNILGARAEYDLTDHFFLGSTFLYDSAQSPIDVPQLGATPNSLAILDADAKLDISQEDLQSVTGIIPGLESWKPPLAIKLSGEVAESFFNPDTFNAEGENGVAMVDNMEGIDSATDASTSSPSWLVSSAPEVPGTFLPAPANGYISSPDPNNNRVRFFNDAPPGGKNAMMDFVTISTNTNSPVTNFNGQSYLNTDVPAFGGHVYANSGQHAQDAVQVLQFPYSHMSNQTWAGLRTVLSANGTDFTNVRYFQTWIYNLSSSQDNWVMFDFGNINEDSNGNQQLDMDQGVTTATNANPGYGIPTFYAPGTPWYPGPGIGFTGLAGEYPSQEGVSLYQGSLTNYVTEDINGDKILQGGSSSDNYYEFGVRVNWTGWKQVKVPVDFTANDNQNTTTDGTQYFFHKQGIPSPQIVRALRLWMTGTSGTVTSGDFWVESVGFTQNLWQLQVDPAAAGVSVNTGRFDVNSISNEQDGRYQGSLRFVTVQQGQDSSSLTLKEKSLKLTYNLSMADHVNPSDPTSPPLYFATRLYSQGLDFTDFQELRLDLQAPVGYSPGDTLFLRLGNDQKDYYQYNVQLSKYPLLGPGSWTTVVVPLDGSDGNRSRVGTPLLNRATQISIGIMSANPVPTFNGELWINNLRTVNPASRTGVARRANAAFVLGDNFATVNTRFREVDSGFTQLDQTSTHFQHSRQYGADYASSSVKLFSQPLVTQASLTHQDLYTEAALAQNPYYLTLPNSKIDNATGSISYTKELGPNLGRLTSVRLSGSVNKEDDDFQSDYLAQQGVQGDTQKFNQTFTLASTYDAPTHLFILPIGTNQITQTLTLTQDTQDFLLPNGQANPNYSRYDRITRAQTYGWTNTTELIHNLVFTPGYGLSLTDAKGNTNSPGVPGGVSDFTPFQERYQPKLGVVYHGINGITPSADYSGSVQYDYVSYQDGTRFNNTNNMNYSLNLSPGAWIPLAQTMGLTIFGGRTESSNAAIPGYGGWSPLSFSQKWLIDTPFDPSYGALTATKSIGHQLNTSFKLFDIWEFRPTGSWNDQLSLLYKGSKPVRTTGRTLGLTTVYNRPILTLPLVKFNFDSAQFQYTHTDNTQYDSSDVPQVSNQTNSDLFSITLPYDINQKAQGNFRLQRTVGTQVGLSTNSVLTHQNDDVGSVEYNQKFAPNLEIHIPFTHLKLQLQDAIELHTTFTAEFVNNYPENTNYVYNVVKTQKYRGTIDLNYNALKNLRVSIGGAYEDFTSENQPQTSYKLIQGNISAEARF
ncbi:MAG TPA: hypothetical protein VMV05_05680 [bacterium]|nr:hypothetical protein [bacterium]